MTKIIDHTLEYLNSYFVNEIEAAEISQMLLNVGTDKRISPHWDYDLLTVDNLNDAYLQNADHDMNRSNDVMAIMGTANAVEDFLAGAAEIHVTFGGIGRFASLEEVLIAIHMITKSSRKDFQDFQTLKIHIESITDMRFKYNKPVIGSDIFHVESGIHVDGIMKYAENYEPFSPESVGLSRKIVLGKLSGRASVAARLKEYNVLLSLEDLTTVTQEVKKMASKNNTQLNDDDLLRIVYAKLNATKGAQKCHIKKDISSIRHSATESKAPTSA